MNASSISGPALSVAIVLLAAGKASRMGEGGAHKLLATFDGVPLVRRMAIAALAAVAPVVVVTGHRHREIEAALAGLDVDVVYNADYGSGIASSIGAGCGTPEVAEVDGMLIMLADMPGITASQLTALTSAFRAASGKAVVRAVCEGKRGNPVVLPRALRAMVLELRGDVGARSVIEQCGLPIIDVEIGQAAHLDVDTPEAVIAAGGILRN
jgi:molybdenum cofactor cytidylyltransferase